MNSNYVIWQYKSVKNACSLGKITGFEKPFRLSGSAPLEADFPVDVALHADQDFGGDVILVDNLLNLSRLIVVSAGLKSAIDAQHVTHVEYLPVKIIDQSGRVASSNYFIVHPLEHVARADEAASIFEMSLIKADRIDSFERLVLDETSVPQDRTLFKLHNFFDITLVRRDLAEALSAGNFSGLEWLEIADYPKD